MALQLSLYTVFTWWLFDSVSTQFSPHIFPGRSQSHARDEQEVYSQCVKESLKESLKQFTFSVGLSDDGFSV